MVFSNLYGVLSKAVSPLLDSLSLNHMKYHHDHDVSYAFTISQSFNHTVTVSFHQ